VDVADLVVLGARRGLPVMEDLGSGCFVDLSRFGLAKEPTVREVVSSGVDVVTFSGDKLLGGPQAGIVLGRKPIIEQIKKNPLNRALRIDKFTLAGLEAVLRLYFDERQALRDIPTLAMLTVLPGVIEKRARRLLGRINKPLAGHCQAMLVVTESRVGGGALPEQALPSRGISLRPVDRSVNQLEADLRRHSLPVLGRIEEERLILDLRTVADDEVQLLAAAILAVFGVEGK
jgi:L-seryl-tRNA(Ser) seleniumtransferase